MNQPPSALMMRSRINEVELYDQTAGYDEETGVRLPDYLTPEEKAQAKNLFQLFNGLMGVCIVVGDPGMGKDLFGNWASYRIKRYFTFKRIWRDEKPRELYGAYAGIFNDEVLVEELARMKALATGTKTWMAHDSILERAADDWVGTRGQVMLKNSVLYLTEYWRYCYNREPHNPMNKTMGGIHKEKRHLDALVLGTVQNPEELDKKTCLPYVDWQITCTRSQKNPTGFVYLHQKMKWDRRVKVLVPVGSVTPIIVDGGKPRWFLGDGKIKLLKPEYRPETEEERIVLEVMKAGIDTYEKMVTIISNAGDMTEGEVLTTLKELKFRKRKRVIDYPCDFSIYNSKSAPQLTTSLKVEE